jgi:3-isopropylmalate dehydrogenase
LPGDGIGPEVTAAAHKVLKRVADVYGHSFKFEVRLIGGAAIDRTQNPLPADTVASCMESSAVFLGAVGGPKWSDPHAMLRPEKGLLELRSVLGVYANLRPVRVMDELIPASPLKAEYLTGVDLLVVRELTGGIYFGKKTRGETVASDLCTYHTHEVDIAIMAGCNG